MFSSKQSRRADPVWWTEQHTVLWEQHLPALRRELRGGLGRESREDIATLSPDASVVQRHPRTPRNITVDRAHAVPDENWETGTTWEQLEPALRWGVGACVYYARHEAWNEELEAALREEWNASNGSVAWEKVKRAVRRGFDAARREPS